MKTHQTSLCLTSLAFFSFPRVFFFLIFCFPSPKRWLADTYGAALELSKFEAGVRNALKRGVDSGKFVPVKASFKLGDAVKAAAAKLVEKAPKKKAAAKPKVHSWFFFLKFGWLFVTLFFSREIVFF